MVLLIDNYDSFVYNLARYVAELGYQSIVKRNDKISLEEITALNPSHIILSPGPCTPNEAGISLEIIQHFAGKIPILGVCLGHQAIGQVFGGRIISALKPMHGKASTLQHSGLGIFKNLKNPLKVARYHSLVVDAENLPSSLIATAYSEEREIMALAHKDYPIVGVQFHPESILTEDGHKLLENFLGLGKKSLR